MLDLLLPLRCAACGASGAPVCHACVRSMRPATHLAPPEGLDSCVAAFAYEGAARAVVASLKYGRHRGTTAWIARLLAARAPVVPHLVVTWAPTTSTRRRTRGFDQAELLARAVARRLRRPVLPLLGRASGPQQTGRPVLDRRHVTAFRPTRVAPTRVLLVDDVVTTGATLGAAAAALRVAGARHVDGLAFAWTPLKVGPVGAEHSE